jgi:peptidoglycan/xylan/chitin deacetylase (PgdA/CDA1 family)
MTAMKLKNHLIALIYLSGLHHVCAVRFAGFGTIFMLHRVIEPDDPSAILDQHVTTRYLDSLLAYLRRLGADIIGLNDVHQRLVNGQGGRPFACFTFDDGYADNYRLALPIFRRHEAPMAVYVATGLPDRAIFCWWAALERLILQREQLEIPPGRRVETATASQKATAYRQLAAQAELEELGQVPRFLRELLQRYEIDADQVLDEIALTWGEAREMAVDPLVTIGAHTMTHRHLSRLLPDVALREIRVGRARLQAELGVAVDHFAYPFGGPAACGEREFAMVRESGFRTATTARRGNIYRDHRPHLEALPRWGLADDLLHRVRVRMAGVPTAFRHPLRPAVTS